ncbi:MAG TPA: branched-chain amino acid ABC transporter permease [Ruminiclostridium sp.]|nr:branched-chain amino acid ABC transporter permease [Ruminiclostridium sp.]
MDFRLFCTLALNGIAMGVVYAMLAMGLILLIRAVGVMNFAQGDLLMFGAYVTSSLILDFELPLYLMIPVSFICFVVIGLVFMFTIYWPLRKASYPAATIIATMGASIILKELATLIWGALPRSLPPIITDANGKPGILYIGGIPLQWQYVLTIIVGAILIFLIHMLFEKLYVGKMMQAACQDSYAANLMGVPAIATISATYIIVVCLASVGGFMIAPIYMVRNTLGTLQLRAFAGVVIGGFGNIKGAIIGSLIVGLVEVFSTVFLSGYKDVTVFMLIILFLLIRPQGLFGGKIADKA